MKTKLEMAHEWYMKHGKDNVMEKSIACAWQYAEAMQAEADKREKEEQEKLKQDQQNHHDELVSIGLEEWQPDWSQAPDGYDWFAVDKKGTAYFYTYKPETIESKEYWADFTGISSNGTALESDSSFGHTGDWRDSLRKRPQ